MKAVQTIKAGILLLLCGGMFACQVPEFPRVSDPQPVQLKVLTYNVWHGLSQATFKMRELEPPGQKEARIQWQITQIKALDPDIVFLQEVNPVSALSQRLADALGQRYSYVFHRDNCGTSLFNVGLPVNLQSGLVVMVKQPLQVRKLEAIKLSGGFGGCEGVATFQLAEFRYALLARVFHPDFGSFYGVSTHLHHGPEWTQKMRDQISEWDKEGVLTPDQKQKLVEAIDQGVKRRKQELEVLFHHLSEWTARSEEPVLLAGDFNLKPDSQTYQSILNQNFKDVMGQSLTPYTFDTQANQENHRHTRHLKLPVPVFESEEIKTWFQTHYLLEPRRIDYIFVSPGVSFESPRLFGTEKSPTTGLTGSDHFGVTADITLNPP